VEGEDVTWEEKFAALKSLSHDVSLRMREPGDWYVSDPGVEIGGDGVLASKTESGATPEAAVEMHWEILTKLPPDKYIALDAFTDKRRHYRWSGFMWTEVPR
jgi:hypothetical protein